MDYLYSFKAAIDLAIQLISLATWILALSLTFMRDVAKSTTPTWTLKCSWLILLISVIAGIWTLMALTGSLSDVSLNADGLSRTIFDDNITRPASVQVFTFLGGIVFLIVYCAQTMKVKRMKPRRPRALWGRLRRIR